MPTQRKLFVFFGLIATGKSTLAQKWAARHNVAYYNSDVVRKELAGLSPETSQKESVDQGIYSKEFSHRTYTGLLERAEAELRKNRGVVLDGSYQSHSERQRVRELAKKLEAKVYFILCVCPEQEMKRRMELRAQDPQAVSDGRWEVYMQQKKRFEAPEELDPDQLITVQTDLPPDAALDKLETLLTG